MCTDQATRGIGRAFSVTQYIDHAALSRLDLLFKKASEMENKDGYPCAVPYFSLTMADSFNPRASCALARSSLGPNLIPVIALGSLLSLQALIVSSA